VRAEGNFGTFGHPELTVGIEYDEDFVRALSACATAQDVPAGTIGEKETTLDHGTMIPLVFLSEYLGDAPTKFVRIGVSGLPAATHAALGKCIAETAAKLGRRTICIASGDLSHRLRADTPNGFASEGAEFDGLCTAFMGAGDFLSLLQVPGDFAEKAGHCGLNGLWVLAGVLDRTAMEARLHSYEAPFGVGYAVASFTVTGALTGIRFVPEGSFVLPILLAAITAVGGGMIRDVLASRMPVVLYAEVYAGASLAGAFVFCLLRPVLGVEVNSWLAFTLALLIRFAAIRGNWSLYHPRPPRRKR